MVPECFNWVTHLWIQLLSSVAISKRHFGKQLPDNIIVDILSRLPAERVSEYRRVCRKWLELTSTPRFAHIHLKRARDTLLLIQCSSERSNAIRNYDNFFIFNKEAKGKNKMFEKILVDFNMLDGCHYPDLYGSYNGLLVFTPRYSWSRSYIFNPTTKERINIRCDGGVSLCGFFFHPLSKEYRLLYVREACQSNKVFYEYFLFSLEIEILRKVSTFPYSPRCTSYPIFLNGALHWIVECDNNRTCENPIMVFDVEMETFHSLPLPRGQCFPPCSSNYMHLLEMTRHLCLCHSRPDFVDIWVLEDYKNCIWVKRYVVNMDWDLKLYPFKCDDGTLHIMNIVNGELLIYWSSRGLFLYNLDEDTVRKIDLSGMKTDGKLLSVKCATTCIKSLVSLKVPLKYPNTARGPPFGVVTINFP